MAKEGRVGLGLWDRLILFVAWVVTCGLVYVLGFYVGKGAQEHRLGTEERIVRLPVTSKPPAEGQRPKAESGLTFYDTLGAGERDGGTPGTPPSTVPHVATPAPPPSKVAAVTPPTASVPPAAPPAHAPAVHPAVGTTPPPAAVPARAASVTVPPPAPAPAAAPVRVAPPLAHDAPPPPPAHPSPPPTTMASAPPTHLPAAPPVPAGRGWTVQANPTRNRDEADALFRQLRGHGYDATIVRVLRDGDAWYRVQVGRFATSGQATETMQRLREHEGVTHVFVASE